MAYTDTAYSIVGGYVAPLNVVTGAFGTPAYIDGMQKISAKPVIDKDTIKTEGLVTNSLAVITHYEISITNALYGIAARGVLLGSSQTSSETGSTPNRVYHAEQLAGGAGFPYVGIVVAYRSENGANMLWGFAKAQLQDMPDDGMEQNKFRVGEMKLIALAPSTSIRKFSRARNNETAASLPSTAAAFDTYFTGLF